MNTFSSLLFKGELGLAFLYFPRALIEENNVEPIAELLNELVATGENVTAFRQRVGVAVEGYDDDPRELWQIPEFRLFFRHLFRECPFVMLLDYPAGGLLKLCFACWMHENTPPEQELGELRISEFLNLAFHGLNAVAHRLMLSEEICIEISDSAMRLIL